MIRFYDIVSKTSTGITIRVDRSLISQSNYAVYAVYDTSTGVVSTDDYYMWRSLSVDTPNTVPNYTKYVDVIFNNSCLYPSYSDGVANYTTLSNRLLAIITLQELEIFESLRTRVDLVRKRLPNPGTVINDTDGIGDGGVVGYAGGFDKKFSLIEYLEFINGALIEINITSPATQFWWDYTSASMDMLSNPYNRNSGVPFKIQDLIVLGGMIRALVSWGILEVDLNFNTVDSNLSVTFDRSSQVASWQQNILNEFNSKVKLFKWDFVNSYGVALGSTPYQLLGLWGKVAGMTMQGSTLSMNSVLGYGFAASRPL
jgi:hypothetical protein